MQTYGIYHCDVGRMPSKIHLPPELVAERQAIGTRIRVLREERDLSQEKLAELAGLDRQSIYRVELGSRGLSINAYLAVATALGVPTWRFFRDE